MPVTGSAIDRVLEKLEGVKSAGSGFTALCPSHDDASPSLSVKEGDGGRVLLHCHAGCDPDKVREALGLSWSDLMPPGLNGHGRDRRSSPGATTRSRTGATGADDDRGGFESLQRAAEWKARKLGGRVEGVHIYPHADEPVFAVLRIRLPDGKKDMPQLMLTAAGRWKFGGVPKSGRPLFHAHKVLAAPLDQPILIPEGEKKVELLESLGYIATCTSQGAGKAKHHDLTPLAGRIVVELPDNDPTGQKHVEDFGQRALAAGAAEVRIAHLPDLPPKGDIVDFVEARRAAGHSDEAIKAEIDEAIAEAVPFVTDPAEEETLDDSPDLEPIKLGERDPTTGRLVLSSKRTLPTAKAFLSQFYTHKDGSTLLSYAGVLLEWRGNRYVEIEPDGLRSRLHEWLHEAVRYVCNRKTDQLELVPFEGNPATVASALETVRAHVHLPATIAAPAWLDSDKSRPPASEILPCRSTSVHLPTGTVLKPTPALFTCNGVDFDYDANAPEPVRWIAFLHDLFGDDSQSIELLQDWFGYALSADTSQQKILLLVGPRRGGKGTVGRVLTQLVGPSNVVGPTVSSLGGSFGLQPLLMKTLAIVSDARFTGDNIGAVIERLLMISGEDLVSVDRKFLGSITMKLPTRFMFLTNELPRLPDAATALAGRFLVLRLTNSFYGTENTNLLNELLQELPGILLWAIAGWHRLRDRGRFVMPESSKAATADIEDLSSPVHAFVRDRCIVGPGHRVPLDRLYEAWKAWCTEDGRTSATTKQVFGRDLGAAVTGVSRHRGTGLVPFYLGITLRDEVA